MHVTITGSIRYDLWGNTVGPDGNGVTAPTGWPFPGKLELSSTANWNTTYGGWVGSPMQTTSLSRCTPAPSTYPVRLLFYMNDPQLWDNGGQWVIHTDVYWGP